MSAPPKDPHPVTSIGGFARMIAQVAPGSRAFDVAKRTAVGTYNDGFIHAGNLAYLSMLTIFPFFILGAALFTLFGEQGERAQMIAAVLAAMPPTVVQTIEPVAQDVIEARSGWLLWIGAAVALWTVSSLIETIRDILHRAYKTPMIHAFWKYRLFSFGLIIFAVVLLILSLIAQVAIGTSQQLIDAYAPQLVDQMSTLRISRIIPALALYGSIYLIFLTLTPTRYRKRGYSRWPGALFTALWWLAVSTLMPIVLSNVFTYDLTYGSLAGIMVALFFFWLVGLGVVIGAELNAALALTKAGEDSDSSQPSAEERETR
ncbi:YihY/virulence factor BrkB family protein [Erythrobacter sp. HA6-11]